MELWIAAAHIIGSVVAGTAWGLFVLWFARWDQERHHKRVLQEVAAKFGTTQEALSLEENLPLVVKASSERYSNELFRNRLSDLCGTIRTLWNWLSVLLQWGISAYVLWLLYKDGREAAPLAWLVPVIAVLFTVASVTFSQACYVLTGRFPGEAGTARRALARLT